MDTLTFKEKIFIKEYIKSLNAEQSAITAGFNKRYIKEISEELLSDLRIVKKIKQELTKQIATLQVKKGYVVQKLLQIAEFSLEEEDIYDKDGNITGKKKLRDTSAGLKALENLSKYIGLLKNEDETVKSFEPKIITIKNLDDKKI